MFSTKALGCYCGNKALSGDRIFLFLKDEDPLKRSKVRKMHQTLISNI